MGASQRRKGHGWERDVAQQLRDVLQLGPQEVKRGLAQPRGGTAEEPDVVLPDSIPYWIECKVGARVNPLGAMRQAQAAIKKAKVAKVPLAICKQDREKPIVVMPFDAFLEVLRSLNKTGQLALPPNVAENDS